MTETPVVVVEEVIPTPKKKFPTLKHYVYGAALTLVIAATAYVARSEIFESKEDPTPTDPSQSEATLS